MTRKRKPSRAEPRGPLGASIKEIDEHGHFQPAYCERILREHRASIDEIIQFTRKTGGEAGFLVCTKDSPEKETTISTGEGGSVSIQRDAKCTPIMDIHTHPDFAESKKFGTPVELEYYDTPSDADVANNIGRDATCAVQTLTGGENRLSCSQVDDASAQWHDDERGIFAEAIRTKDVSKVKKHRESYPGCSIKIE